MLGVVATLTVKTEMDELKDGRPEVLRLKAVE
jgi:hypothetical protein